MTDFKAGTKAILDKKEVVDIIEMSDSPMYPEWRMFQRSDGSKSTCRTYRLTECLTVRILTDGQAREVNRFHWPDAVHANELWFGTAKAQWREAEAKRRTLPWTISAENIAEPINFNRDHNKPWYAFIEVRHGEEAFVLVKPLSNFGK